jgi:hypothetical protein
VRKKIEHENSPSNDQLLKCTNYLILKNVYLPSKRIFSKKNLNNINIKNA